MPRYFKYFFISFFSGLALVAAINWTVDPAHLFQAKNGDYERGAALFLAQGKNVANLLNFDDRLLIRYYVEALSKRKEVLVLGSSRGMEIRQDSFPGQSFFNACATGSVLQDFFAVYHLFEQKALAPSRIILCLDPWILNRNHGQTRWTGWRNESLALSRGLGLTDQWVGAPDVANRQLDKYHQLLSWSYFQNSLSTAWALGHRSQNQGYYPTEQRESAVQIHLSDGSLSYDTAYRAHTPAEVETLAIGYPNYSLDDFVVLDPQIEQALEAYIDFLQRKQITVEFVLMPYHPLTYEYLRSSPDYHLIVDAQRYFEGLARKRAIRVRGSYNPKDIGCDASEFYDALHSRESCVRKVLAH